MVMVRTVPWRRTRAAIAGFPEVVACFVQTRGGPVRRVSRIETPRGARDVEYHPMPERSGWRVGVLEDEDQAAGLFRSAGPRQWRRNIGSITGVLRRDLAAGGDRRAGKHQRHGGLRIARVAFSGIEITRGSLSE